MDSISPYCSTPSAPSHKPAVSPTRPIAHALATDYSQQTTATTQFLPTPTSLPTLNCYDRVGDERSCAALRASAPTVVLEAHSEPEPTALERTLEPRSDTLDAGESEIGGGLPFEMEIDVEAQDVVARDPVETFRVDAIQLYSSMAPAFNDSAFSSSHRPHRIARARYASSESPSSPPPFSTSALRDQIEDVPSTHKRSFSHVSSSTSSAIDPDARTAAFTALPVSPRSGHREVSPEHLSALASVSSSDHHPLFSSTPLVTASSSRRSLTSPPAHGRSRTHSFEPQRASAVHVSGRRDLLSVARESQDVGEEHRGSNLRRRSPASSSNRAAGAGLERERGGSKRRRASTLLPGAFDATESSVNLAMTTHQGSQSFAPALGRFPAQAQPVAPVLSRSTSAAAASSGSNDEPGTRQLRAARARLGFVGLDVSQASSSSLIDFTVADSEAGARQAGSRHAFSRLPPWWRSSASSLPASDRPALPSLTDSLAIGTSTSFLATSPLASRSVTSEQIASTTALRPRPSRSIGFSELLTTFSQEEQHHTLDSSRLHREGDAILREAEETLRAREAVLLEADETTRRASRLLFEDRQDRERERRINTLPDVGTLPEPAELAARPVIGMRIGEGWPATTTTPGDQPDPTHSRPSPLFSSLPSPLATEDLDLETTVPIGNSSRTRQFLSSLRSRRPRVTRDSINDTALDSLENAVSSGYDEEVEHRAANDLNHRLLERRRISASLEPPTSVEAPRTGLWGETLVSSSRSRMRGFTESQNERWRRGQAPLPASGTTTATFVATVSREAGGASGSRTPLNNQFSSLTSAQPPAIDPHATPAAALTYFSRRSDSPSPRRLSHLPNSRRTAMLEDVGDTTSDSSTPSINEPELGPSSSTVARPVPRLSLHFAAPAGPSLSARLRLGFDREDEDEDASRANGAVESEPRLPLMLPSGSEGRRMTFPHPAYAAGRSDSLEAAEEGRARGEEEARHWTERFGPDQIESSDVSQLALLGEIAGSDLHLRRMEQRRNHEDSLFTSRFDPFGDLPTPLTTTSSADARTGEEQAVQNGPAPPSLADTLSMYGTRSIPRDSVGLGQADTNPVLRRRHSRPAYEAAAEVSQTTTSERYQESHDRLLRQRQLAAMRRERALMRGLLDDANRSGDGPISDSESDRSSRRVPWRDIEQGLERRSEASPPRSPNFRRRGLGEFFRGLGAGGRLISIFDEEYGAFFGRDALALDSRNYLEDDEFDASYEGLLRLSAQIGDVKPKGIGAEALARLRTFPYSQWPYIEHASSKSEVPIASTSASLIGVDKPQFARKGIEKEERCGICLMDYEEEDDIALAHCSHGFHAECLKAWLKDHGSCPVCRRDHTA
ncbi:uncharacterized protein JCM15063_004462 [Sporobolomyces koalae]|uniref:uncharacterized protein n=1 Tax=Sporobolomyces koalae TaxID=500713 RepID=UPI0031734A3C